MMELGQARLRSASHGSLHNAYRNHGRHATAAHVSARPPSRRRALRSVNENSTLLRCPGPLESMLKTTTETGDIGVFSIKTGSLSHTQQPPRSKHHLIDVGTHAIPTGRAFADSFISDQDRQYRFHRDTTSEIISLYGSDNHQYWLRTSSPTLDDGHRSYSMTTSSSRQIPSQKSSTTLQSLPSSNGLQRPRSPFPYPTRLKRPGVRPLSPAVAENGGSDYRKAVESEKVLQRATHGSHKPSHVHGPRRPPPLSLRTEANRSTASLPSKTSPGTCNLTQLTNNTRAQYPSLAGTSVSQDRNQDGSTEHSVRSASLTSIVDMYQRPFTAGSAGAPVYSGSPLFYDYTEEFDKPAPLNVATDTQIPICPVPQRAGGNCRPLVLQQDTDTNMAGDNPSAQQVESIRAENQDDVERGAIDEVYEQQQSRRESGRSIEDVLSIYHTRSDVLKVDDALEACLEAVAQKRSTPPPCSSAGSRPGAAHFHDNMAPAQTAKADGEVPTSWWRARNVSKSLRGEAFGSEPGQAKRTSQSSMAKLRCTLDPALSEFASLFSSLDRLAKTPFSHRGDEVATTEVGNDSKEIVKTDDGVFAKRLGRRSSLQMVTTKTMDGSEYRRRHRRNAAAMRIDTTELGGCGRMRRELSPPKEEATVLSPEPISPMQELRVKNSIPRLMKALPPLPWEAVESFNKNGQSSEQPRRCPWSRPSSTDRSSRDQEKAWENKATSGGPDGVGEGLMSPPRFKVRVRTLSASRESSVQSICKERQGCLQGSGGSAARPRLKLKLSRSRLGQVGVVQGEGRRNRLKQCNSLADLALTSQKEAESSKCRDSRPKSACGQGGWEAVETGTGPRGEAWRPAWTENRTVDAETVDKAWASGGDSASTQKGPLSEMRSFSSDVHPVGQGGLRQKLSMLRLRVTGASRWNGGDEAASEARETETQEQARSTRSERMGGRVRKWASDAKQAVRLYMRKTLDRGSG